MLPFLLRQGVCETVLDLATRLAALRQTLPRDELFACGLSGGATGRFLPPISGFRSRKI
jgi:hypothetical protein